nr:bacteriohemerythrin [uncultured Holophaga sp.]
MLAQWNDSYRTGHSVVDGQHQKLFTLVNDLHEAIIHGQGRTFLVNALKTLADYCASHFTTEEKLMDELGYPEAAEHKRLHRELAAQAAEVIEGYSSGRTQLPLKMGQFLNDWLSHHIGEQDKKFIAWVRTQGR